MLGNFAREAVAALLLFAKATSDPNIAAALLDKAADLKERVGDDLPKAGDLPPGEEPVS